MVEVNHNATFVSSSTNDAGPQQHQEAAAAPFSQTAKPRIFIRGTGSGIPGLGDPDLKGGKAGALLCLRDVCVVLEKDFGIHNPKTGNRVDRDWAKRNMGLETYSCGNIEVIRKLAIERGEELGLETKVPETAVSVTEYDLCFKAFDEALQNANLKPKDIDFIVHVSPTLDGAHFWAGMCEWKKHYPELRDTVQLQQHPIGCPAFLIELKMAAQLLCSADVNNVAIIVSNHVSGKGEDYENAKLYCSDNDLKKWVNMIVFGDGAGCAIISTDEVNPLPEMVYDLVDVDYKRDHTEWVSRTACPPTGLNLKDPTQASKPIYELNVRGPLLIKGALDYWCAQLKKRHGFTLKQTQHVALHTANPKVLSLLTKHYGLEDKVSYLPNTIGNLGPASCVTNLHDLICGTGGRRQLKHTIIPGDTIMGFALGAASGVVDGVFLLKARLTDPDARRAVEIQKPYKIRSTLFLDEGFIKFMWACMTLLALFFSVVTQRGWLTALVMANNETHLRDGCMDIPEMMDHHTTECPIPTEF